VPWPVFVLLFVSVWINYIDRGTLGVAAPVLAPELGIDPTKMGVLLSAFFWTYSICLFFAGWMVDRLNVVKFYAAGFFIWSVATLGTGVAGSFVSLLLLRMLLGAGESVAFPSYCRILAAGFPEYKRGMANALIDVGTKAGPAVGTFLGGMLVASYGWRGMFLAMGAASLLWLAPWLCMAPNDLVGGSMVRRLPGPGVGEIMRKREAWATFFGLFFFNYTFYFLISWLPSYLVSERHLSVRMMATFGALPFVAMAAASLTGGWVSDLLVFRGVPVERVRKTFAVSGSLLSGLTLPGATISNMPVAMILTVVSFIGIGILTSNLWAITQTLAGPRAAGKWTGVQNGIGNMGGVLAPILTGWTVTKLGSYNAAFLIASVSMLCGALMYGPVLGRIVPSKWNTSGETDVV
jgi:MFS family permease